MSGDVVADEDRIDALRLKAFRTNAPVDRQAYFDATSKWFQDRHYRDTSQAAEIERLTKENATLQAARNENAKLKGQRDAALARIEQMQVSNSRMAEGWSALVLRTETAERLLADVASSADDWNVLQSKEAFDGLSQAIDAARTLTNGGENGR